MWMNLEGIMLNEKKLNGERNTDDLIYMWNQKKS